MFGSTLRNAVSLTLAALILSAACGKAGAQTAIPTPACGASSFPNTPSGVTATATGQELGLGQPWRFRMVAWRLNCQSGPVLLVTITPTEASAGSDVRILDRFKLQQPIGNQAVGRGHMFTSYNSGVVEVLPALPRTVALNYGGGADVLAMDLAQSIRITYEPVEGDPVVLDLAASPGL